MLQELRLTLFRAAQRLVPGAPVGMTPSAFMLAMQRLSTSARESRRAPACDLPMTRPPIDTICASTQCCPESPTDAAALNPVTRPIYKTASGRRSADCYRCLYCCPINMTHPPSTPLAYRVLAQRCHHCCHLRVWSMHVQQPRDGQQGRA